LPPHLAKFFDKKGDLKPEVAARVAKGREKLNWKDVTPKGYGPKEEVEIDEIAPWKKGKYKVTDGKTGKVLGTFSSGEKAQKYVDKIWDKGDYDSLTVELGEEVIYTRGVELDEKWEVGVVYHQEYKNGDRTYFRADSVQKNTRWKGMSVD
jgi:hypothetical protein